MAYGPSKNRTGSQHEHREPNLIPIMNLFIVIIPMLMTIMVSVHLAMIEITLPAQSAGSVNGEEAEEQAEELPKMITLALFPDRFEIKVEGDKRVTEIPQLSPGRHDFVTLDKNMAELKIAHEKQGTIEVLPDPTVRFDTLLRSIDICKSNDFPNIKYLTALTKYYRAK